MPVPAGTYSRPRGHKFFRSLQIRTTVTKPARYAARAAGPSSSPTPVFKSPSSVVVAAASVASVVGALVMISLGQIPVNYSSVLADMNIGIGLWKCRTRRRQNQQTPVLVNEVINENVHVAEKHIDLDNVDIYMEKPERALLVSDLPHMHAGWIPQVPSQHGSGRADVYALKHTPTAKKPKPPLQVTSTPPSEDSNRPGKEKPRPSNPIAPVIHTFPSPVVSATNPPTPPAAPPITREVQTNIISVREVPQAPIPGLRSESFGVHHGVVMPNQGRNEPRSDDGVGTDQNSTFPRLMTVVTAFAPNLADEVAIEIDEPVCLLDEYRDGWCLVQRVTKSDAPKGVVPRSCLCERRILPITPARSS